MAQILTPTKCMLKAAEQYNCQVPLISMEKCQYKYCSRNNIEEPQYMHLEELDDYWSEFLMAQRDSSANYIYKIHTFGSAQDPTLVKKDPISMETVQQRLLNMSCIGGLRKTELFYLLSFLLNLTQVPAHMQRGYMDYMINQNLLDLEIINYLQLICHHPNAALTEYQVKEFQEILQNLIVKNTVIRPISYYNPEHIFLKSPNQSINPYELEFLRKLFRSNRKLTAQQTMYLTKLVYKLQEMQFCQRESYLAFLREQKILPFNRFQYLIVFLAKNAKRINTNKLRNLLRGLQSLMGTSPCEPAESEIFAANIKTRRKKEIEIDYLKIDKAFNHLMKCVIPNIVRLTDLKKFLLNLMILSKDQVVKVLNGLKIANIMTKRRFKFVEDFIKAGQLGKIQKSKKREFMELLKNVADAPIDMKIMINNLDIPASKGPTKKEY